MILLLNFLDLEFHKDPLVEVHKRLDFAKSHLAVVISHFHFRRKLGPFT